MKSETVAIVAAVATLGPVLFFIPSRSLRALRDLFLHASKARDYRDNCDKSAEARAAKTI
jgi:hypothetical protein